MRKKITRFAAAAACLFLLAGCGSGGGGETQAYTKEQAQEILDSGAFTDELEELDCDTAWALYGLEGAGLARDQLTDGMIRRSAGATCEELSLLIFSDAEGAETAVSALETYLQAQIDSNQDYRPAEIPKLEDAFLQQADNTVLMVVSNDTQAVQDILG